MACRGGAKDEADRDSGNAARGANRPQGGGAKGVARPGQLRHVLPALASERLPRVGRLRGLHRGDSNDLLYALWRDPRLRLRLCPRLVPDVVLRPAACDAAHRREADPLHWRTHVACPRFLCDRIRHRRRTDRIAGALSLRRRQYLPQRGIRCGHVCSGLRAVCAPVRADATPVARCAARATSGGVEDGAQPTGGRHWHHSHTRRHTDRVGPLTRRGELPSLAARFAARVLVQLPRDVPGLGVAPSARPSASAAPSPSSPCYPRCSCARRASSSPRCLATHGRATACTRCSGGSG